MRIKAEINVRYESPELHVCNYEMNEEVQGIMRELHEYYDESISGVDAKGNRCMLRLPDIVAFYAQGQRVMALDGAQNYVIPNKLYELERDYGERQFVRISKSELVNVRKIQSLDMSATGTIKIVMKSGYETYVSRRNIKKIKERVLQEGGRKHE